MAAVPLFGNINMAVVRSRKHSIRLLKFFDTIFNKDHAYTTPGATYHFLKTGLSSCVGLEVMMNISGGRNCSTSGWLSLSDLSCENLAIIPRARVGYEMLKLAISQSHIRREWNNCFIKFSTFGFAKFYLSLRNENGPLYGGEQRKRSIAALIDFMDELF